MWRRNTSQPSLALLNSPSKRARANTLQLSSSATPIPTRHSTALEEMNMHAPASSTHRQYLSVSTGSANNRTSPSVHISADSKSVRLEVPRLNKDGAASTSHTTVLPAAALLALTDSNALLSSSTATSSSNVSSNAATSTISVRASDFGANTVPPLIKTRSTNGSAHTLPAILNRKSTPSCSYTSLPSTLSTNDTQPSQNINNRTLEISVKCPPAALMRWVELFVLIFVTICVWRWYSGTASCHM